MTDPSPPIEATISLGVDDKTRHWLYFRLSPRSEQERENSIHKTDIGGASATQKVKVYDGRDVQPRLTLDDASFELVECPTKLSTEEFYALQDLGNPRASELKDRYYEEVRDFAKSKLGCDEAIVFHHQVRSADGAGAREGVHGYAGGALHTDSSPVSADEAALSMAGGGRYERYAYLNLWRNISDDPIENDHLAMLDERTTVKPDDYIAKDLFMDNDYHVVQYNLGARHAHRHKWYYYPRMTKDEGILFKQMDSDWTKPSRICFHMSVGDAGLEAAKNRESIEVRMMCYWAKADSGVDSMPTRENTHADLVDSVAKRDAAGASLESASALQLLKALLWKPFAWMSGDAGGGGKSSYSGDPADYAARFTEATRVFPSWPAFAKAWVKGEMQKAASKEDGIKVITVALVDDQMGYQGTKGFSGEEKAAIVEYLLEDEGRYLEVANKNFGELKTST